MGSGMRSSMKANHLYEMAFIPSLSRSTTLNIGKTRENYSTTDPTDALAPCCSARQSNVEHVEALRFHGHECLREYGKRAVKLRLRVRSQRIAQGG